MPAPDPVNAGNHAADILAGLAATGTIIPPTIKVELPTLEKHSTTQCHRCAYDWYHLTTEQKLDIMKDIADTIGHKRVNITEVKTGKVFFPKHVFLRSQNKFTNVVRLCSELKR